MIDLRKVSDFQANPSAAADEIRAAEVALGTNLPEDYVDFLLQSDGGEGFVCDFYVSLWRASQLKEFNDDYGATKESWLLFFGSNGAGEGLAFLRETAPWCVALVPLIGLEQKAALSFGDCFSDFLQKLSDGFDPFRRCLG